MRIPRVARALLDYRWRRLDAARQSAARLGHRGARFPWQSGSDGTEATPRKLFNPRSGHWIFDHSSLQLHVGLAVAYNVWQYVQSTSDLRWFAARGAELLIEVARFFADLATYDDADGRFHIAGVMGPDEYHDGYPDAPGQGLRDNAYTNVLTAWVCQRAVDSLELLAPAEREELEQRLDLQPGEPDRWALLGARLAVPLHEGIISQFDGYERLEELDWDRYRSRYASIERLDLILEAEGDSPNRYRLSKQADVLMLVYLLGPSEVVDVLARLGYPLSMDDLSRVVDYYLSRSSHGSTLSRVVHTSVLTMLQREGAWSEFREALDADLDDVQGGTTGRGIHLGAMAGTVDIVLRSLTGMRLQADALVFSPRPPAALRRVGFELSYRDLRVTVSMDQDELRLTADAGPAGPVHVVVDGTSGLLRAGRTLAFPVRVPTEGGAA
jgi:trehalose/maltose hydrolase-like predicted phosphorylase